MADATRWDSHRWHVYETSSADVAHAAPLPWVKDDGGRAAAGYKGETGDCAARAIAIATGLQYQEVYDAINETAKRERPSKRKRTRSNARTGVHRATQDRYLQSLGWVWTPTVDVVKEFKS